MAGTSAWGAPALAGYWITPGFAPGQEPSYRPVPLYWFEVPQTPYAYRTTISVAPGLSRAAVQARSSGYLYVYVDGRPVFEYVPREGEKSAPGRTFAIDFTPYLTPGRHAIVISAPREGFAMDGLMQSARQTWPLATGSTWQVRKFPPTVILEDEPWMRPSFTGRGAPVAVGAAFSCERTALQQSIARISLRRAIAAYDDNVWRLGLLAHKGIVIRDGSAYGWAGAARADPGVIRRAGLLLGRLTSLAAQVDRLRGEAAATDEGLEVEEGTGSSRPHPSREAAALFDTVRPAAREADLLARQQSLLDELRALRLAARVVSAPPIHWPRVVSGAALMDPSRLGLMERQLAAARRALTAAWGYPLNAANESRYDRLGWTPDPDLVDSQMDAWGLRVNPLRAPAMLRVDGKEWRFSTDPGDTGESEKRQTAGYNIENQWRQISVPGAWNEMDAYRAYRGTAWYRVHVQIPAEWRGHDLLLRFPASDSDQVWMNDVRVGATGSPGVRRYRIGKEIVRPGADNLLAFEVTGRGEECGITGSVTLSVPELEAAKGGAATTQVLSTPLSPAVVLTAGSPVLEIQGWADRRQPAPRAILLPGGRRLSAGQEYRLERDGKLAANWAILWLAPADAKAPDRPVMLVFEQPPLRIIHEGGGVRVLFRRPGARVVAVRPWVKQIPEPGSRTFAAAVAFWRRAALAVPVDYMELTRCVKPGPPSGYPFDIHHVPPGPVLRQTVVYDYLLLRDAWGTKPLKIAPLPSMASYALDVHYRGLQLGNPAPAVVQDGGLLAAYRALKGADRVTYSYPIEPFPRLAGFTSWMFSPADTGVPGNRREVELLKTTGANCYRPQNNFSTEKSPFYPESDPRTRIEIMADACNSAGMSFMNNVDQTLGGPREAVRHDYERFMERVDEHWESIARQLHDRPFFDVAYDLVNEPFDHPHGPYNRAMKQLTARVRAIDPAHRLAIEPMEAWGAIDMLRLVEPTGDPLTLYSFHDYNFRLLRPEDRWPTEEKDISSIYRRWREAFRFEIQHGVPMHCGEFGGFDNATDDDPAQLTLMNDFFRIFDQFGMSFNYYSGRVVFDRQADGSMAPSNVVRAYRRYFQRGDFNQYYPGGSSAEGRRS